MKVIYDTIDPDTLYPAGIARLHELYIDATPDKEIPAELIDTVEGQLAYVEMGINAFGRIHILGALAGQIEVVKKETTCTYAKRESVWYRSGALALGVSVAESTNESNQLYAHTTMKVAQSGHFMPNPNGKLPRAIYAHRFEVMSFGVEISQGSTPETAIPWHQAGLQETECWEHRVNQYYDYLERAGQHGKGLADTTMQELAEMVDLLDTLDFIEGRAVRLSTETRP